MFFNTTNNLSSVRKLVSSAFFRLHLISRPKTREVFAGTARDIYLVSYPRSGNTWMRVMLAEILFDQSGTDLKALQYYVPDIHVKTYLDEIIPAEFHVIKSHLRFDTSIKNYKRVIYLVRDPRDVVLSYYRYQQYLSNYQFGLDEFILDLMSGRIWPGSWEEHVISWTAEGIERFGVKLHLVRYEDLLTDTLAELKAVLDFCAIGSTEDSILHAIRSASVKNMRHKEELGMRENEKADGFKFIGSATAYQWQQNLTKKQADFFLDRVPDLMDQFGYL